MLLSSPHRLYAHGAVAERVCSRMRIQGPQLRMCIVTSKKRISVFTWQNNTFVETRELAPAPELPKAVVWCDDLLICGYRRQYAIVNGNTGDFKEVRSCTMTRFGANHSRAVLQFCTVGRGEPFILSLPKKEFLVNMDGALAIFTAAFVSFSLMPETWRAQTRAQSIDTRAGALCVPEETLRLTGMSLRALWRFSRPILSACSPRRSGFGARVSLLLERVNLDTVVLPVRSNPALLCRTLTCLVENVWVVFLRWSPLRAQICISWFPRPLMIK